MNSPKFSRMLFVIGALFFSISFMILIIYPRMMRTAPVEADDSYVYIFKAVQMNSCFFQTCPSLGSLIQQIDKLTHNDNDFDQVNQRIKEPLFLIYHPLHSVILIVWHSLGFSWEHAYFLTIIIGALIIITGIVLWLKIIWGEFSAGFALVILSFSTFPDQGLHYVVPSNICLGIGLISWSILITKKNIRSIYLILGVIILISMHRVGIIYAAVSVFLYCMYSSGLKKREIVSTCFVAAALVGLAFILPELVNKPIMKMESISSSYSVFEQLEINFKFALRKFSSWNFVIGYPFLTIIVIMFGLIKMTKSKEILATFIVSFALMAIGIFHNVPGYPAELFSRTSIVFGLLFVGILGSMFQYGVYSLSELYYSHNKERPLIAVFNNNAIKLLCILVLLLSATFSLLQGAKNGVSSILASAVSMITRHNMNFDYNQPIFLNNQVSESDTVLFSGDTVPMTFFLVHSALGYSVAYLELFNLIDGYKYESINNSNLKFGIAYNPISRFVFKQCPLTLYDKLKRQYQGIRLDNASDFISVSSDFDQNLDNLLLRVENPNRHFVSLTICWTVNGTNDTLSISIPPGVHSNLQLPKKTGTEVRAFKIGVRSNNEQLYIQGLKFGSSVKTDWGWDQGLVLSKSLGVDQEVIVELSSANLFPGINRSLKVEMDRGTTILTRFVARIN